MEFAADEAKPATGGEVTLFIDDRPVGKGRMDHTVRSGSPRTRGWISAGTTAASWTSPTRIGNRSRSPAR